MALGKASDRAGIGGFPKDSPMSIYSGSEVEQSYAQGRARGYEQADLDIANGRNISHERIESGRCDLRGVSRPDRHAHILGWLRGYREIVRTYGTGGWGT